MMILRYNEIPTNSSKDIYYNKNYITQDSFVGSSATVSKSKADDILNSKIFADKKATAQKEAFKNTNSVNSFSGKLKNTWWNSNHWENLLNNPQNPQEKTWDKNLLEDYSQWKTNQLGMNVPLSLIKEKSFIFTKTSYPNIFALKVNFQQNWVNNSGQTVALNDPHWGINFDVNYQNEKYSSNQIVNNIDNAYLTSQISNFLNKNCTSFNEDKSKYSKV